MTSVPCGTQSHTNSLYNSRDHIVASPTVERWIPVRSATPTGILVEVLKIESANRMTYISGSKAIRLSPVNDLT